MRVIGAADNNIKKQVEPGKIVRIQFIAPAGKQTQYTVTIGGDSFTLQADKTKPAIQILERQIDPEIKSGKKVTVSFKVTMQTRRQTEVFDCRMSIGVL